MKAACLTVSFFFEYIINTLHYHHVWLTCNTNILRFSIFADCSRRIIKQVLLGESKIVSVKIHARSSCQRSPVSPLCDEFNIRSQR